MAHEEPATPTPKVPSTPKAVHGTPKAGTPHNRAPVVPSSSPGTSMRSPQMIQFGKYDISTWYSSPYPQVLCLPGFQILNTIYRPGTVHHILRYFVYLVF